MDFSPAQLDNLHDITLNLHIRSSSLSRYYLFFFLFLPQVKRRVLRHDLPLFRHTHTHHRQALLRRHPFTAKNTTAKTFPHHDAALYLLPCPSELYLSRATVQDGLGGESAQPQRTGRGPRRTAPLAQHPHRLHQVQDEAVPPLCSRRAVPIPRALRLCA